MKYTSRLALNLALAAATYFGSSGIAAACGCINSRTTTMSDNGIQVSATSTIHFNTACEVDDIVTLTAPNSDQVSTDSGTVNGGLIAVTASYTYGGQGGTYTAAGTGSWDGDGYGSGDLAAQNASKAVCGVTISPGGYHSTYCTDGGLLQNMTFNAIVSPSLTACVLTTSSCSVVLEGGDLSLGTPSSSCSGVVGHAFFYGPDTDDSGSLTLGFSLVLNSVTVSPSSTIPIVCP